ncbi:hypothetical protein KI387_040243, partial [Taxus chinensis]
SIIKNLNNNEYFTPDKDGGFRRIPTNAMEMTIPHPNQEVPYHDQTPPYRTDQ